jgi:hypothetical protein
MIKASASTVNTIMVALRTGRSNAEPSTKAARGNERS